MLEEVVNGFLRTFPVELYVGEGERMGAHQKTPAGSPLSIMLRAFAFQRSVVTPLRWL